MNPETGEKIQAKRRIKDGAFGWYNKQTLRHILKCLPDSQHRKHATSIIACYVALTCLASNHARDEFEANLDDIADLALVSWRTAQRACIALEEFGVIKRERQGRGCNYRHILLHAPTKAGKRVMPLCHKGVMTPSGRDLTCVAPVQKKEEKKDEKKHSGVRSISEVFQSLVLSEKNPQKKGKTGGFELNQPEPESNGKPAP